MNTNILSDPAQLQGFLDVSTRPVVRTPTKRKSIVPANYVCRQHAAVQLGLTPQKFQTRVQKGVIPPPSHHVGKMIYYTTDEVVRMKEMLRRHDDNLKPPEPFFTVKQLAAEFGCAKSTVTDAIRDGTLPKPISVGVFAAQAYPQSQMAAVRKAWEERKDYKSKSGRRIPPKIAEAVINLVNSGVTKREAGEIAGVSQVSVFKIMGTRRHVQLSSEQVEVLKEQMNVLWEQHKRGK